MTTVENVLVIVIDALRRDRVGAYGDSELTPNLDRLAADGAVFERCYAPINATDAAMTSLLSGCYPTRHGVLNHGRNVTRREREAVAAVELLPELLADTHERFAVDLLGRWHRRGYDEYVNPDRADRSSLVNLAGRYVARAPEPIRRAAERAYRLLGSVQEGPTSYGIDGERATDAAIDRIEAADSPWFGLVHYWETHCPYVAVEDCPGARDRLADRTYDETPLSALFDRHDHPDGHWIGWLRDHFGDCATVGDVVRRYDAATWWVDAQVGRLLESLRAAGIAEETAVVVTADHGESLTGHGILFDHHGLYEPSIRVPLLVDAPGLGGRDDRFVQHFDLVPTLLSLLGREYDPARFDGESLVDGGWDRGAAYAEEGHTTRKRAIRTDRYKYVTRLPDGGPCRYCGYAHGDDEELYDLRADPGETENLVDDRPDVARSLSDRLSTWVEARPDPGSGRASTGADEAALERLEDMGYI